MYSYNLPINALRILREGEHQDVMHYIKNYNLYGGFMYGLETDTSLKSIQDKMQKLLDDGSHSGGSWGFMMRLVQAVLVGSCTDEYLLEAQKIEDEHYRQIMIQREEKKARMMA